MVKLAEFSGFDWDAGNRSKCRKHGLSIAQVEQNSVVLTVLAWACFLLAVGLFSSAVLLYTGEKRLILPTGIILGAALVLIVVHAVWFPQLQTLDTVFSVLWRLGALLASLPLLRLAWGRPNIGRWLLAAMLPVLHLHLGQNPAIDLWHDFLLDLALGISPRATFAALSLVACC